MTSTIKDYALRVYWDERAGYYVADIPEVPTCAGDGATYAEALANLEETFAVMKEAYLEARLAFPSPSPQLPVSVASLSAVTPLVKVAKVAKLSGIAVQTLAAKVKRGTEFSLRESTRISQTLSKHGLALVASPTPVPGTAENSSDGKWMVKEGACPVRTKKSTSVRVKSRRSR